MKFDLRIRLVRDAETIGIKPAARKHGCTVKTARKWLRRWIESGRSRKSLLDRSRAPHSCPHKIPAKIEKQIVRERNKATCLGARRLRKYCEISASEGAIARVLRQKGLARKRKKKYEKKRDMRELKARFNPFEENQVDVKYLNDIPYYVEQMWRNPALPKFEYTWRDVKTGGLFLGFADELSEAHIFRVPASVSPDAQPSRRTTVPSSPARNAKNEMIAASAIWSSRRSTPSIVSFPLVRRIIRLMSRRSTTGSRKSSSRSNALPVARSSF